MKLSAVITGDLVASRKLPAKSRDRLYADIRNLLSLLKSEGILTAHEMFRGDSIQCVVNNKEDVLRTALLIRAWLKSYTTMSIKAKSSLWGKKATEGSTHLPGNQDIRLSMGIGVVDFFEENNLAHSDGEAFQLSGTGLDNLKHSSGKMILQTSNRNFNEIMEPVILLLDALLEKWTGNQAEIILFKLKNYKEEQIAREIGISQSAVNQRTKTSQWNAIEKLLFWFEKTIKAW